MEFMRGVMAVLGLFFAYVLGRSFAGYRAGRVRQARLTGWAIRTAVCALAVAWRHAMDASLVGAYALMAASFAGGMWQEGHRRQEEDLTSQIFPDRDKQE